jgi:hypothetical protein
MTKVEGAVTKPWMLLFALVTVGAMTNGARADCVLCRCIYGTDFYGTPIRTSSSFPARGTPECLSKCTEVRLNCVPPGVCYPVTSRRIYQVFGRLPELQCPNPPPYASPFGPGSRGSRYSIPY